MSEETKYYKFTEINNWEIETWRFYIKMTEAQRNEIDKFISKATEYRISKETYTEEQVNLFVKNARGSYMASDNKFGEFKCLPTEKQGGIEEFYKGGIEYYCMPLDSKE